MPVTPLGSGLRRNDRKESRRSIGRYHECVSKGRLRPTIQQPIHLSFRRRPEPSVVGSAELTVPVPLKPRRTPVFTGTTY